MLKLAGIKLDRRTSKTTKNYCQHWTQRLQFVQNTLKYLSFFVQICGLKDDRCQESQKVIVINQFSPLRLFTMQNFVVNGSPHSPFPFPCSPFPVPYSPFPVPLFKDSLLTIPEKYRMWIQTSWQETKQSWSKTNIYTCFWYKCRKNLFLM